LLVAYVSAALHALLLQLNCICVTTLGSLENKVNVVAGLFIAAAHQFILMVLDVGGAVSITKFHVGELQLDAILNLSKAYTLQ
jgi:hypothetical protein